MDDLLKSGLITEQDDGHTLSYILQDRGILFMTGYKVLQSQADSGFVNCMLVSHNGKDKLVYDISRYRDLASLLPDMQFDIFICIMQSLIDAAIAAKENGFIQCRNIIADISRIYVDTGRYKVFLVYLPVLVPGQDIRINPGDQEQNVLETAIYKVLAQAMDVCCTRWGKQADILRRKLFGSPHSLRDLKCFSLEEFIIDTYEAVRRMGDGRAGIGREPYEIDDRSADTEGAVCRTGESYAGTERILCRMGRNPAGGRGGGYRLVGLNTEESFLLTPNRKSYLIGRSREADGCLSGNRKISKKHCRIERRADGLWLMDAGSLNGTFVNNTEVKQGEGRLIGRGDIVRLADILFCVEEE